MLMSLVLCLSHKCDPGLHDPEPFRVFSGLETNEEYQTHRPTKLRFRVKIAKIRRLKI